MKTVQSMDNKYIKLVKSLQNRKYREKNNMFFDEGIKKTIQWYIDNQDWWKHIISGEYKCPVI